MSVTKSSFIPIWDSASVNVKTQSADHRLDTLRQEILSLVEAYTDISLAPQPFIAGKTAVPPSGKLLGSKEIKNMVEASLDGWLTAGRFNEAFEKELA